MKLSLKKTQVVYAPLWHPNFRNAEALPDLKVVRTSFFVNVGCITLALAAVLFTAYREYMALSLRSGVKQAEVRIESAKAQNGKLLAMNREFNEGARKFTEAGKFLGSPVPASAILVALSRSLPGNMDFTSVAYDGYALSLRGTIRGVSETATSRLDAYLDVLRKDAVLAPRFSDVKMINMNRDPRTQAMVFEILLKPAAARASK